MNTADISLDPNPNVAIIVGIAPQDPIREVVQTIASTEHFDSRDVGSPEDLLKLLDGTEPWGSETVFVLISLTCVTSSVGVAPLMRRVCGLRPEDVVRLVVYPGSIEGSSSVALDCIQAGACDYLVFGSYDLSKVGDRFMRVMQRDTLYPRASSAFPELRRQCVFTVTPYSDDALRDYRGGIKDALRRHKITAVLAADTYREGFLPDNVLAGIVESEVVVANISSYGRPPNPNVFLEVGCARALGKHVMLVRQVRLGRVPSDIRGLEYIEYTNAVDLALKLYFIFKR